MLYQNLSAAVETFIPTAADRLFFGDSCAFEIFFEKYYWLFTVNVVIYSQGKEINTNALDVNFAWRLTKYPILIYERGKFPWIKFNNSIQ